MIGTAGPPRPHSKTRAWHTCAHSVGVVMDLHIFPDLAGGFLMTDVVASEDQGRLSLGWEPSFSPGGYLSLLASEGVGRQRTEETNHLSLSSLHRVHVPVKGTGYRLGQGRALLAM